MSINYTGYLLRIVNDPSTSRVDYMRAWEELRMLERHQHLANIIAKERAALHKQIMDGDKLTGGQDV